MTKSKTRGENAASSGRHSSGNDNYNKKKRNSMSAGEEKGGGKKKNKNNNSNMKDKKRVHHEILSGEKHTNDNAMAVETEKIPTSNGKKNHNTEEPQSKKSRVERRRQFSVQGIGLKICSFLFAFFLHVKENDENVCQ